jgi:hypothetical protein
MMLSEAWHLPGARPRKLSVTYGIEALAAAGASKAIIVMVP